MGTCVFCGFQGKLTGEHAWPDWLRSVLPEGHEKHVIQRQNVSRETGEPYGERSWEDQSARRKVAVVCHDCNHGWMSDLETAAKPYLVPLVRGDSSRIGTGYQRLIAFWAIKTALMLQFIADKHVRGAPAQLYAEVYKNRVSRRPPRTTNVMILRYENEHAQPRTLHATTAHYVPEPPNWFRPDRPNAFATAMVMGHLVVAVVGYTSKVSRTIIPDDTTRIVLFPGDGRPVKFPPPKSIPDWPSLQAVVNAITAAV